jgi:lipopolysaccharide/colanic/teichoic acid biosynthesis glycosyltransferase
MPEIRMRQDPFLAGGPTRYDQWYERLLLNPVLGHMLGAAVALAGSHLLAYGTLNPGGDDTRWHTLGMVLGTYLVSVLLGRKMNRFPGARAPAYMLAVTATVFAILFGLLLLTRTEYARGILFGGFLLTLLAQMVGILIDRKFRHLKLALVPVGDYQALPEAEGTRWHVLTQPDLDNRRFDAVVADLDAEMPEDWARFIAHVSVQRVPVFDLHHVIENLSGRINLSQLTTNDMGALQPPSIYEEIRRVIEVLAVLALSPVLLPVLAVLALMVKLDSPGPVLFSQLRVGRGNRTFRLYKFRSMRQIDDQTARFADEDAHRITRFGHFIRKMRLDELPQLWNVLKGEMSLIGPRPEQPDFVAQFEKEVPFYTYRHMVRPGITGWAQVQQGYAADVESTRTKVEHDFYYIRHFSPWLDLLIILKTVKTILTGFGAR